VPIPLHAHCREAIDVPVPAALLFWKKGGIDRGVKAAERRPAVRIGFVEAACDKLARRANQFDFTESLSSSNVKNILLYRNSDLRYQSPSPRHHEGRFAVVTKRGAGCDGTRPASGDLYPTKRWQRTVKSCGPGAATLALRWRNSFRRPRGQERPFPGESTYKPSNHCAGKAGMSWLVPVKAVCALSIHCTRCCGCRRRPAFPAPSIQGGSKRDGTTQAKSRRENESTCLSTSLRAKRSNPESRA